MKPSNISILATLALAVNLGAAPSPGGGERIALVGNGLGERMLYFAHFETELHLRFPEKNLVVRNLCRPGNTAGFRPHSSRTSQWAFPGADKFHPDHQQHLGQGFYPTPDQWLTREKPDTILAFFGYNESFDGAARVANFRAELDAFIQHTLAQKYNGRSAPRLLLVSPIAFEDLSAQRDLPDGQMENENLALYCGAMQAAANANQVEFVDLFSLTKALQKSARPNFTINGFLPTDAGYRQLAPALAQALFGESPRTSKADPELLRKAVLEKDWFWFNDYQVLNGVHVYGRRHKPFGPANYPDELEKTREMTLLREARVHQIAAGKTKNLAVDDSNTLELKPVKTNFNRPITFLEREQAIEKFTMRDGFKIELFASEREFPDLRSPVQMSFDRQGRLWVAVTPSYPHYKPGGPRPNDKLIILEDTDGDGRADNQKVFADGLHLPIGFELAPEGVYLSQEPNLCLLPYSEEDRDKAGPMQILMHGFDSHDTHHAISAYCADASGAFYLNEGRFLHSQVETPYGPQRCNDGGVWRFDPKRFRLERYSQADYNNPWGVSFDFWEQCYISDASSGNNYWALPVSAKLPYGIEMPFPPQFAPKRARPTSGPEFVSSSHFPDELQGNFMICNSIGFLGVSLHQVHDDESGISGEVLKQDLVSSSDPNFRPVDIEFAPDGSLYMVDWHNPLIGHMQHNARDPKRDSDHGRIYRITYPDRPLVDPAKVAGASVPELLDNLKIDEYRTRYRSRRELRAHPAEQVIPAIKKWAAGLDRNDPRYEHHLCEALWASWAQNRVDASLLDQCLDAQAFQARAAATHVLRYAQHQIPDSKQKLMKAATDENGRVRLEAIVTASWMDNRAGATIALEALKKPLDKWMAKPFEMIMQHTLKDDVAQLQKSGTLDLSDNQGAQDYLAGKLKIDLAEEAEAFGPTRKLTADEQKIYALGAEVYARDAHCATCHSPNGKGVPNIYPPLEKSDWLNDDERIIKIALKGLWGEIEVTGQKFDPKKGVPPMMGFAPILNDEELAAALSYVRTSFGNEGNFISAEQVKAVRHQTRDRANFYDAKELLEAHPLK